MPIYEYRCEDCGGTFSLLQKMGAGERETCCPACGSDRVRKLISAPAVGSSAGVAPAG
ncbi:MAG TPA: zinc ribbon domain-containing protein, partial [Geobacter sulfurreducens]|nr:zinc ribbon domain-containing protein [Geobacter sulfurreducens]